MVQGKRRVQDDGEEERVSKRFRRKKTVSLNVYDNFHVIPFSICLCTNKKSRSPYISSKSFKNLIMYAAFLSPAVVALVKHHWE